MTYRRPGRFPLLVALALALSLAPLCANAAEVPGPFATLQLQLSSAADHAPGRVGIAVEDLATGAVDGVNDNASLPAASTIKIPVMVEVFKQMEAGSLDLDTIVHLEERDRDWGWGDMAPGLAWANAAMQVNRSAPENVAILQILWEIIGGVPPWRGNSRACTEPMASGCKLALPSNRDFDPSYNGMPRPRPRVAWRASAFPRSRH